MPTFDDVRAIAMALPEAEEVLTWETDITFRVRKKIFAIGGEGSESRLDQGHAGHPVRPHRPATRDVPSVRVRRALRLGHRRPRPDR